MKYNFTEKEYEQIVQLIECALDAPNKKDARAYISKLQVCGCGLSGRTNNIFNELVCYVKDASGKVTDKEGKINLVKSQLYKLEIYGVEC